MTTTKLTDEMIRELCVLTTRDEAGRHFTEWSRHFESLEELGLVEIDRPVHEQTGIRYDSQYWAVQVTDAGLEVIDANPELHPA